MKNNIFRLALGTAVILLIPLLLKWPWTLGDFVIMGILIFGTGLIFNFVMKNVRNNKHRVILGAMIILAALWLYIELAVGLFTNWGS